MTKILLLLAGIILLVNTQLITPEEAKIAASQTADSSASISRVSISPATILPIKPKCPDCFVTQICGNYRWTKWLDRDNPSGTGDWETVYDLFVAGQGCQYPIWIECETTTGIPWWQTGEVIQFTTGGGCICKNASQPDLTCNYDYQIRELCP